MKTRGTRPRKDQNIDSLRTSRGESSSLAYLRVQKLIVIWPICGFSYYLGFTVEPEQSKFGRTGYILEKPCKADMRVMDSKGA